MAPPGGPALLERLLHTMAEGPAHSISALAQELDVSEEMVSRMIQDLVRLGYLRSMATDCADACAACPLAGSCVLRGAPRVWLLTERGNRAGAREAE
jgi:DNA-binding IscR family transcriptional regulator